MLPRNDQGQYVHNEIAVLPTSSNGRPIVVVGEDMVTAVVENRLSDALLSPAFKISLLFPSIFAPFR